MAQKFTAKRLDESKINGGNRYNLGYVVSQEAINAPIEGVLYAQNFLDVAMEKSQVALDGFYQVKEKQSKQDKQIEGNRQHVKVLYNIAKQKEFIDVAKVEQAYTSRETADGENIVDEQYTDVLKIKGSTVVDEITGTLKHAYINSIKSTGRNLIPYPYTDTPTNGNTVTKYGVTFTDNGDGSITVKGTATGGDAYFYLTSGLSMSVGSYYMSGDGADIRAETTNESGAVKWVHKGVNTFDEVRYALWYIVVPRDTTADYTVYPMLNHGTTALPFESYTEDIYKLPHTLELGEFDSFNPQTGELVRGTGHITSQTGFTDEEIANYDSAIVSIDKRSLEYALAAPTTETIANAPKGYKVHNHGNETVAQGETDNSKFGAMVTITNEYMIIL